VLKSPEAVHEAADLTVRMIEAADQAGLDSAWVSEDPEGWDAIAVLSAATWTTKHIRLGTGVTNPYIRHPNLMASSVSTLDRLSGGRAFLGLGRGQPEWYRESLGADQGTPLTTLETTIRLLHQWWKPPYRAHSREGVHVYDWARAIRPLQDRPPIYLAAVGPKALDLAARMADGLLVADFASIPYLEKMIPDMKERISRYGRDPESFHFYVRTGIQVTDDPAPALRYRKTLMALNNRVINANVLLSASAWGAFAIGMVHLVALWGGNVAASTARPNFYPIAGVLMALQLLFVYFKLATRMSAGEWTPGNVQPPAHLRLYRFAASEQSRAADEAALPGMSKLVALGLMFDSAERYDRQERLARAFPYG
jgi:alkanesulfonate monooxygenase SsuD/methylene tetrahydromethanopterin reductase-like flavin-dependent oxidoreductase (luciferase family)